MKALFIKLISKTWLGSLLAKIGTDIHKEQMRPILQKAFGSHVLTDDGQSSSKHD